MLNLFYFDFLSLTIHARCTLSFLRMLTGITCSVLSSFVFRSVCAPFSSDETTMATSYLNLLSSENVVFKTYAFYSVILIIKMMMMSFLTILQRLRKKTHTLPPYPLAKGETVIHTIQNQLQKTKSTIRDQVTKIKAGNYNCFKNRVKVFVSPEDVNLAQNATVENDDPDVERVRRAHLNDLENIPIFLISGLLFVLSNPNEILATTLFRMYTVFRIMHTVVYTMIIVRQPARVLMFFGGFLVNLTMCVLTATKFLHL